MDKEKKEKLNISSEVVTVNTNVKRVVAKKKETNEVSKEALGVLDSIDAHMEDNANNTKVRFDYKTLITYILLILIVGGCILLILNFYDNYKDDLAKKNETSTTSTNFSKQTTTTRSIYYQTTTTVPTQATHTVFDKNRR